MDPTSLVAAVFGAALLSSGAPPDYTTQSCFLIKGGITYYNCPLPWGTSGLDTGAATGIMQNPDCKYPNFCRETPENLPE